ncbi:MULTISPECIES: YIP1 family protein [Paenibacillus]|uniref:Yip1 domain-containing protein n=1 Tax=Paenibacillus vini TaxID=1476024 RepID=A0ABQ4MDV4_9BACL|nr:MULTISPECIES: YIP1 family protein [Paenibacillus]MBQ4900811.1 YIP1 family protein [Paenibacillus sp. Marseille-P2973]MDN4070756.1 YIP1 family protein [Paenibacillus vini]GIP54180.1 hypothetical protein J42TS3_32150 [Paenibacillus vini]
MKNLFTIFVSPTETFQRVREKSKTAWIFPLILLMVVSTVAIYLQLPAMEQATMDALKKQGLVDPSNIDSIVASTNVVSIVTTPLSIVAMIFVGALLYVLLNLIVRGEAKYMQLVTMMSYAALPGMLGSLLAGIMVYATEAKAVTDVSISLAALVSDKTSMLYYVLTLSNPFAIWGLVLYVIGASVMMKRPRKTVGMWIVGTWLVFSLGSLLFV